MDEEVSMTEFVVVVLAVVVVAAVVYAIVRPRAPRPVEAIRPGPHAVEGVLEVTIAVDNADPASAATQRLVTDAARRVLARDADVTTVVVRARNGRELGRVDRPAAPVGPVAEVPAALREPHAHHHSGPHEPIAVERAVHGPGHVRFEDPEPQPHRTLVEHFELADAVRSRIGNAEDPVDLVGAILGASGRPFDTYGSTFRCGDRVLIVLHTPMHVGVDDESLSAAFLRYQASGARRGVVLTVGNLHVRDVQRREALAPALLHAGPEGIQRMADAVAMGADPLDFVTPVI